MSTRSREPAIVGVAHATRRPACRGETSQPADLIAEAVRHALRDAGVGDRQRSSVDALYVVNMLSWRYRDPAGFVAERAQLQPALTVYSPFGGEQPLRLIDQACRDIQAGRAEIAVVAGGEAMASRLIFRRTGEQPPWPTKAATTPLRFDPRWGLDGGAYEHGLTEPTAVYPLFEAAYAAAKGATPCIERERNAALWSAMSQVASKYEGAWHRDVVTADAIATAGPKNRPIAHPYTKLMCAQPNVDQAAAVVLATPQAARRLGVVEERMISPWTTRWSADPVSLLERPTFAQSRALTATLLETLDASGLGAAPDLSEFYSCFPVVPKLALDALGLPQATPCTVAGGLTFHGGPFNVYMLCAAVAMVRRLREGAGTTGLLYGNGGFLTKHATMVLGREARAVGYDGAPASNCARESPPELVRQPRGRAVVETATVLFGRDGTPARGIVIGRQRDGRRFVAASSASDDLVRLLDDERGVVGLEAAVTTTATGNSFTLA